jgi:hypothetical protein
MKALRGMLTIASVALALLPAANAADTSRTILRGVVAQFQPLTSPDGCTVTFASVQAWTIEYRRPEAPATESDAYFTLATYDQCAGQTISSVEGSPELPPGALVISDTMDAATLDIEAVGVDSVTGSPVPVSVSLSWRDAVRDLDSATSSHFKGWEEIVNYRSEAEYRTASVEGSVRAAEVEYAHHLVSGSLFQEELDLYLTIQNLHSSALAAVSAATLNFTGSTSAQSGESAQAEWVATDDAGCMYTQTSVGGSNRRPGLLWGGSSDTFSTVSVQSWTYDYCTQTAIRAVYAYGVLDEPLRVSLGGARVMAVLDGYDYVTGTAGSVALDLEWTATGSLKSWQLTQQLEQAGSTYQRHVNEMWRDAEVAGVLTADGTPLTQGAPVIAVVSTFDDRIVTR